MPEIALRFGLSNGAGLRAATWKLWTNNTDGKFDVYLANRALGDTLKASLHESGQWHIAYSQKTFEEQVQGAIPQQDKRFIETWPRPPEIEPGITLAYVIITPSAGVTAPIDPKFDKKIQWLRNAPEGKATEIAILIAKPEKKFEAGDWPGKASRGTSLIGSFPLANGETVWVVGTHVPQPDIKVAGPGVGRFYKGKSREDLKDANLRVIVFGDGPAGSRVMYDCPVQVAPDDKTATDKANPAQ
jgi:hypothetical protein